jgi:hypothetical protein
MRPRRRPRGRDPGKAVGWGDSEGGASGHLVTGARSGRVAAVGARAGRANAFAAERSIATSFTPPATREDVVLPRRERDCARYTLRAG